MSQHNSLAGSLANALSGLAETHVDLTRLDDAELDELERLVEKAQSDTPTASESGADYIVQLIARNRMLQAENDRLQTDIEKLRQHYSAVITGYERERCERAAASVEQPAQSQKPAPASVPQPAAQSRARDNVVPLRGEWRRD
jgi:hypothetical protein